MWFKGLTLRGASGSFAAGYQPAATATRWTVRRRYDEARKTYDWALKARVGPVNWYYLRQRPLLFTAPRRGGFWCWPVQRLEVVDATTVIADLGPPEY